MKLFRTINWQKALPKFNCLSCKKITPARELGAHVKGSDKKLCVACYKRIVKEDQDKAKAADEPKVEP